MTSLLRCLSLFTVVPVRVPVGLDRRDAGRALRWLPLVGGMLGALAGLLSTAARQWAPHATVLGAVASVAALAVLTRALHLDGLADTADGLGSRAEAQRALEIMRRSDIGPFGVVALLLVLAAQVAAISALPGGVWTPVAALAVAAATGRLAVVHACSRQVPPARPGGFGALVAGAISPAWTVGLSALAVAAGVGIAAAGGRSLWWWAVVQLVALGLVWAFRRHTTHRFGGTTGDVFGSLIEAGTVVVLTGLALH